MTRDRDNHDTFRHNLDRMLSDFTMTTGYPSNRLLFILSMVTSVSTRCLVDRPGMFVAIETDLLWSALFIQCQCLLDMSADSSAMNAPWVNSISVLQLQGRALNNVSDRTFVAGSECCLWASCSYYCQDNFKVVGCRFVVGGKHLNSSLKNPLKKTVLLTLFHIYMTLCSKQLLKLLWLEEEIAQNKQFLLLPQCFQL